MDEATLQRVMTAAIQASQATGTQQIQSLKKPDLPTFDRKNIETWIKRIEAAYKRVNCTQASLKFAHLESKFEVDVDPIIDGYLYGEANEEEWKKFLAYLRKRYGKTKKEKTLLLINGIPRDGRTPSQLAAVIKERTKDVTIDDIQKEQLLKQLPTSVISQIIDKIENLTFEETAKLADSWFDQEGNLKMGNNATSINQVTQAASHPAAPPPPPQVPSESPDFTPAFASHDDTDINAIRARQGQKQAFNNRGGFRGRGRGGNNNSRGNSNTNSYGNSASYGNSHGTNNNSNSNPKPKNVCHFHIKFGDKAQRCEEWCLLKPQHQKQQGNGRASL